MPADLSALRENLRAFVEIKTGATAANRCLEAQLALVAKYLVDMVNNTLEGGPRATSTTFAGESFSFDYPGANNDDLASALRELRNSLIAELSGGVDTAAQVALMPRMFLRR